MMTRAPGVWAHLPRGCSRSRIPRQAFVEVGRGLVSAWADRLWYVRPGCVCEPCKENKMRYLRIDTDPAHILRSDQCASGAHSPARARVCRQRVTEQSYSFHLVLLLSPTTSNLWRTHAVIASPVIARMGLFPPTASREGLRLGV